MRYGHYMSCQITMSDTETIKLEGWRILFPPSSDLLARYLELDNASADDNPSREPRHKRTFEQWRKYAGDLIEESCQKHR